MKIFLLLLISFLFFSQQKQLNPEKIVKAINCGSSEPTQGSQGFAYSHDQGYSKSRDVNYQTNEEYAATNILYSLDQAVYKTERHNDDTFGYQIELKGDGTYVLILKFCEMYFKYPKSRLFNIKIGEKQVVKDLDIVKHVGFQAAYDEYIEFELKNNQIYYKNEICPNAYDEKSKKIVFEIEKGAKDLPLINGIVLYEGKLVDTDYAEQESIRAQWKASLEEQRRLEEEAKRKRYEAKNRLLKNIKEDEFKEVQDEQRITGLIRILTSLYGAIIFGILFFIALAIFLFGQDPKIKEN